MHLPFMPSRVRLRARLVVGVGVFLLAAQVAAQDLTPKESRERIKKLQESLQSIHRSVPTAYGENLSIEAAQLDAAEEQLARLEKAIQPSFAQAPKTLAAFERNLETTTAFVKGGRRAHTCAQAVADIIASHAKGTPAAEGQMQALNTALQQLKSEPAGFGAVAEWCEQKMSALVEERAVVAQEQEATQAAQAAELAAQQRQEELKAALTQVTLARQDIDAALAASQAPLPPNALAGMQTAANKVFSLDEEAGKFILEEIEKYKAELAWRQDPDEGMAIIAGALKADVASVGTSGSKTVSFSFNAERGRCYAALMRFKTFTGDQRIEDFSFTAGRRGTAGLQLFSVDNTTPTYQLGEGFCATSGVRVKGKGKVFAGRSNGVNYVVLSWSKDAIPPHVLAQLSLKAPDRCDTDTHTSLWTDPVPGTVVYLENIPHLWTTSAPDLDAKSKVTNPAGQEREVVTGVLTHAPKTTSSTTIPFIFRGCPRDGVDGPHRKKLNRCLAKVEKRYAKKIKRAERKLARAKSERRKEKAQDALNRLLDQREEREDKKCGRIEDDIMMEARAAHQTILQNLASTPPTVTFDRVGYLQKKAKFGL